LINKEEEKKQR